MVTSILGWWQWRHHEGHRADRPITRTSPAQLGWTILAGSGAALAYGWLLHRFTDAYAPFPDAALLALSVVAQFLLMRRKLETWLGWFLANSIAIPLYASRELWLTALFYALFWFNAPLGFFRWRRELRAAVRVPAPSA